MAPGFSELGIQEEERHANMPTREPESGVVRGGFSEEAAARSLSS